MYNTVVPILPYNDCNMVTTHIHSRNKQIDLLSTTYNDELGFKNKK